MKVGQVRSCMVRMYTPLNRGSDHAQECMTTGCKSLMCRYITALVTEGNMKGRMAYMPSALLLNGLLEDCLALPSFNHVFHLLLSWPLPSHNEGAPFYHFSAECMPHTQVISGIQTNGSEVALAVARPPQTDQCHNLMLLCRTTAQQACAIFFLCHVVRSCSPNA